MELHSGALPHSWRAAIGHSSCTCGSGFFAEGWPITSVCVLQAVGVHGFGAAAWPVFPADQRCHLPRRGSETGRGWGSFQSCSSVPKASSRGHEQAHRDLPGEALCKYSCLRCWQAWAAALFFLSHLSFCLSWRCALNLLLSCLSLAQTSVSWTSCYQPLMAPLDRWGGVT